uniref:Uncharacterized protein n=1 Tax=Cannabis sativa TaxID=3483 RepID=A0A803PJ36_CANSA
MSSCDQAKMSLFLLRQAMSISLKTFVRPTPESISPKQESMSSSSWEHLQVALDVVSIFSIVWTLKVFIVSLAFAGKALHVRSGAIVAREVLFFPLESIEEIFLASDNDTF